MNVSLRLTCVFAGLLSPTTGSTLVAAGPTKQLAASVRTWGAGAWDLADVLKRGFPIAADEPKPGEVRKFEIAPGVFMEFCWIPAGEAQLGSPKTEQDFITKTFFDGKRPEWLDDETEAKRGKYRTQGFWLGKYPVTQGEWEAVMGNNPSYFDGKKDNKAKGMDTRRFPVECVSWDMISKEGGFLEKVNKRGGAANAFGKPGKFVLPHEDEWEYAARGGRGNGRAFYWGDKLNGTEANCNGNYPYGTDKDGSVYLQRTCAVDGPESKKYEPHVWGLHHVSGNVCQWCENNHELSSDRRVLRGGSWRFIARHCRSALRGRFTPDIAIDSFGFRVCFRLEK